MYRHLNIYTDTDVQGYIQFIQSKSYFELFMATNNTHISPLYTINHTILKNTWTFLTSLKMCTANNV